MKIVFWNIRKNEDVQIIHQLVKKSAADLLFLAECPETLVAGIDYLEIMPPDIESIPKPKTKPKVRGFRTSNTYQVECVEYEHPRLWFYTIGKTFEKNGELMFLLGTVHLVAKRYYKPTAQQSRAQRLMQRVKKIEETWKDITQNTIMIGDFNMNPFDPGMVIAEAFNSVCSQEIARKQSRMIDSEDYTFFYNPSWKIYAGVGNHVHGTYYYHTCKTDDFHWNNFDQVLLRPSILEKYDHRFEVLHETLNFDLRKSNNNNKVPDHYPIMLEIKERQ